MESAVKNALNEVNAWWDICSLKADLDVSFVKVEISELMAMMESLRNLDLLRSKEDVELEM